MRKYNGINMNSHYTIAKGVEYWFIYQQSDNPDETADVTLFPGDKDEIVLPNMDLGSCSYILYKEGEFLVEGRIPISSMGDCGRLFIETEIPLEYHEISYERYATEIDADYRIYIDTHGFCAAKQSMFTDEKEMASEATVYFEQGYKTLGCRTVEKIYSMYHVGDVTPGFLEYLESAFAGDAKTASKLFDLMANMSFCGFIRFEEGDVKFGSGILDGKRSVIICEHGKEEKVFQDDEKESGFMNWILGK